MIVSHPTHRIKPGAAKRRSPEIAESPVPIPATRRSLADERH
jgi:hypothetical protein